MQHYKYHKLSSKVLVLLIILTLVISPFQTIAYASTVESDQVEDHEIGENELENDNKLESKTAEVDIESTDTELPIKDSEDEQLDSEVNLDAETSDEVEISDDAVETSEDINENSLEETEGEEDQENNSEKIDYSNFNVSIDEINTTSDSITITWSTPQVFTGEFELYLNYDFYTTVSSDTNTYTFTDLTPREQYDIEVSAIILTNEDIGYEPYFSDRVWVTPDWNQEELVPVSIITMFNENPTYNHYIRIRGLDENNKSFLYNRAILENNSDLSLPVGKLEVTIYNERDPSIVTVETIEINEDIDYINNPIQLQIRLKEMNEAAEPFQYEIKAVTENSFTIHWNTVSKITGFKINASELKNDYYSWHSESDVIENNTNEYTFYGLNSNKIYSIQLLANYLNDLDNTHYFKVKTDGEDAKDQVVNFANETLHNKVAEELGIHFRNVTEADMKDLFRLYIYSSELDSLNGLEHAQNLYNLYAFSNQISNIDSLSNLVELEYLSLDYNKISDISPLKKLNKLYSLDLSSNKIVDVDALAELTRLEYLYLTNNQIKELNMLKNLNKLEQLYLGSNEIANIDAIASLSSLAELYLHNNQIIDVSPLQNLKTLSYLNLSTNSITNIKPLAKLSNLDNLYLGNNQVTDISSLSGLKQLVHLSLYSNEISNIDAIGNLTKLESLELSNNNISDIAPLNKLENLTYLDLYSNEISDISDLVGLKNLETIHLSYNKITDITPLKNLPKLQTVYLDGMDITDIETIQFLRNEGVYVYYDGDYGDWNDWDDEWNDEEDIIIDREEVLKQFPEDQGFIVSDDGKTVELDLGQQSEESFELTPDQTRTLIENNQTINLKKDEVQASIPASSFDNYDEPVTININEVQSDPNSLSNTYDFTIKQGTRTISQFEDGIALTFNVNASRAKNPNNLKVFYFNEETNKWEKVPGSSYSNGTVTVVTYHFSIFTVFEVADEDGDSDDIVVIDDTNTGDNNSDDSNNETIEDPAVNPDNELDQTETDDPSRNTEDLSNDDTKTETVKVSQDNSQTDQNDTDQQTATNNETNSKDSNELPNTATNVYNMLAIGVLLIAAALTLYIFNRKKATNQ